MIKQINNNTNPPHLFKQYISTQDRAPRKKFFQLNYNFKDIFKNKSTDKNSNNNLLNYKKNKSPIGQKIIISGIIFDKSGKPLPNVFIEIWQANASGKYRDVKDTHNASIDKNFLGCGNTISNSKGLYKFFTIMPGAYPWKNHKNAWRPKHIHFSLLSANFYSRLCTQMYFPNDLLLKYDPIFNSVPYKYRKLLIAQFDSNYNSVPDFISYNFNIVMP